MSQSVAKQLKTRLFRERIAGNDSAHFLHDVAGHRVDAPEFGIDETAKFLIGYFAQPPHNWPLAQIAGASFEDMAAIIDHDGWKHVGGLSFDIFRLLRNVRSVSFELEDVGNPSRIATEDLPHIFYALDKCKRDLPGELHSELRTSLEAIADLPEIDHSVRDFFGQLEKSRALRSIVSARVRKAGDAVEMACGGLAAGGDARFDQSPDDSEWPTVTEAAKALCIDKYEISRAASAGQLRSNGKTARARRIDPAHLLRWHRDKMNAPLKVESAATMASRMER